MEAESVDLWKQTIQKEIDDLKSDVGDLKRITHDHDRDIKEVKTTLADIKDDTKWLRRTITNAIIITVFGSVIGGGIAIVFSVWGGN